MQSVKHKPYRGPSGGWGSVKSLADILRREGVPLSGPLILERQNKADGFQCISCAWPKPAKPLPFEFCENGAKATAWEITTHRATPEFFARHSVEKMLTWADYDLEQAGRITEPLRYDQDSDRYVAVSWTDAFTEIGRQLKDIEDRKKVVFYSSGRTSNEASYIYGLFARLFGNNNLPDSSNMCHETTSVALPESIGVPVGTTILEDFAKCDCLFFFGQNAGSNSPRMLHALEEASQRGVPIITYNPLRERGLERFTNPQSPMEMLTLDETRISSQYHQVKAGGDLAALTGICKWLVNMDDEARAGGGRPILDHEFIKIHTHGFETFIQWLRNESWENLERESGLTRSAFAATATVYANSSAAMGIYGMGLTQHRAGVETVQMLVNLLLLKGNIGREGAGICPVRGHSNVQGQRTVGITEKPELLPLDNLRKQYGFEPPQEKGLNTVEAVEELLAENLAGFIGLGGNFARAIPDQGRTDPCWRKLQLTVHITTKLNRSHLLPGRVSYLLPVLGRTEIDKRASGPQALSMEDSTSCIHGSRGVRPAASRHLRSEVEVVARIAMATLDPNPKVPWKAWMADYSTIRRSIGETYPETFYDYDQRMWEPGGFHRSLPARERKWKTKTGKANFITPKGLEEDKDLREIGPDALRLITLRSNDQFNTTIYGYSDRFRGISGSRMVVFMNREDVERLGLSGGDEVTLVTQSNDGHHREAPGFKIIPYGIPVGCVGAYYPETNLLLPIGHYAEGSKTPAAKSIPVTIRSMAPTMRIERAASDINPSSA
ncbi:FdhF/YdeP family oxidoreductase [Acidisoma cellulosilyticum]|uniref:FdhF/YdeP family oxidoreductase n=1 Tax=Acidisoma cellulosilyticum TaxID=2802395 RepID=UPI001D0A4B58|nr:FdhF/YdeP family oxidoreductase [Acidisoma cellulosilyticum]